jgi:hypothetical protein
MLWSDWTLEWDQLRPTQRALLKDYYGDSPQGTSRLFW